MKFQILLLCLAISSISCFIKTEERRNPYEGIELNRGYKKVEEIIDLVGDINHAEPNINIPSEWLWNDVEGVNFLTNV